MPYDFKKALKEQYAPKPQPAILTVPPARFVTLQGQGDPNQENGPYQQAVSVLYAISYTLKMSYKTGHKIDGFFEYVVPPLEGFWWQEGAGEPDYTDKARFHWLSALRVPDFVTENDFAWAVESATKKKKLDCSAAALTTLDEGLCVQMLHLGPYDTEPESIAKMDAYIQENGYANDVTGSRLHHEIYLSDPRKTPPEKWKTILRHPIKRDA